MCLFYHNISPENYCLLHLNMLELKQKSFQKCEIDHHTEIYGADETRREYSVCLCVWLFVCMGGQ